MDIAAAVGQMLAELRAERLSGRSQPDLIETGIANLGERLDGRPHLSDDDRDTLLQTLFDETIGRLPAANHSPNPALESFLIQTLAEVIDRLRGSPI